MEQLPLSPDDPHIQAWISALASVFALLHFAPGKSQMVIDAAGTKTSRTLLATEAWTFKKEIVWVKVLEGEVLIQGSQELTLTPDSPPFPCVDPIWITASTSATVRLISHKQQMERGEWQESLRSLSTLFNRSLVLCIQAQEKIDALHLRQRSSEQEKTFRQALEGIKALFSTTERALPPSTQDPLEQVLLQIGRVLHVEFLFPKQSHLYRTPSGFVHSDAHQNAQILTESRLEEICEASQVRMRKVILDGNWKKQRLGPLLCFQNGHPVAHIDNKMLLPNEKPLQNGQIDSVAYMFYPPFPPHITTGKQLCIHLLKNYLKLDFSLILYGLLASLIAFLPPIATSLLFQYAVPLSSAPLIHYLFLSLVFASIGFMFFYLLRNLCFLRLEGLASHFVQTALWDRLLRLPPSFFRKFSSGSLYWKMESVTRIRELIRNNAAYTIISGVFSFLYLCIMWIYSPKLTAIAALLAFFSIFFSLFLARRKARLVTQSAPLQETTQGNLLQMILGIAKLRSTGSEKNAFAHWASLFTKSTSLQIRAQQIQNIAATCAVVFPLLSMWGIYFLLIEQLGIKAMPLHDFLAFNIAFGSFSLAVYPLNETILSLVSILPFWERTKVIFQERPETQSSNIFPGLLSGKIYVDAVSFSYEDTPVLHQISLTANPGELIGIVGPSGSGKSTLLRLLLGFEKPSSGVIYYDDKDLSSLNVRAVRRQIGSVLQTSGVMAGTLYSNLVCGGSYSPTQIRKAIQLSGFEEDLAQLPMGLHTYVSAEGGSFSGGQKQRLLLARALLGNPSLLIFDEATSALDTRTQRLVTANIDTLNVTRIIVAQRLSTIRNANRIYVFSQGRIVQVGTFAELFNTPGLFRDVALRQQL
jgi:NHLM bacteriocin system ABC transporter ATP-binding protein